MKQTRIMLLALLISTAASGQEAASAGAPADMELRCDLPTESGAWATSVQPFFDRW